MSWGSPNSLSHTGSKLGDDEFLEESAILRANALGEEEFRPANTAYNIDGKSSIESRLYDTVHPSTASESEHEKPNDERENVNKKQLEPQNSSVTRLLEAHQTATFSRDELSTKGLTETKVIDATRSRSAHTTSSIASVQKSQERVFEETKTGTYDAHNLIDPVEETSQKEKTGSSLKTKDLETRLKSSATTLKKVLSDEISASSSFTRAVNFDWQEVPIMSVSRKPSKKNVKKVSSKLEKESTTIQKDLQIQAQDETKQSEAEKITTPKSETDEQTQTKTTLNSSKVFFERLKSQLDAIKRDAKEDESEINRTDAIVLSPAESDTSSDVFSLPIPELQKSSSDISVASSLFDVIRETLEADQRTEGIREEDVLFKLETPDTTGSPSYVRSHRPSATTIKSARSKPPSAATIKSGIRSRGPSGSTIKSVAKSVTGSMAASVHRIRELQLQRKSIVSFKAAPPTPPKKKRPSTQKGLPFIKRDESTVQVSAPYNRFRRTELPPISGDFKPVETDLFSVHFSMEGESVPVSEDESSYVESEASEEPEIDRQLYRRLFEIAHTKYLTQIMVNNFFHNKMADYYKDRKMFFVLAADRDVRTAKKKYLKLLNSFDQLRHKEEVETMTFTDSINRLRARHAQLSFRVELHSENYQYEVAKYASTLNANEDERENLNKIVERFFKRRNVQMKLAIDIRKQYIRIKNRMFEKYEILKNLDRLGPGFTIMDYQQLKTENKNLSDRHDIQEMQLTKTRNHAHHYMHILAHRRQKFETAQMSLEEDQERMKDVQYDYEMAREQLNNTRHENRIWRIKMEDLTTNVGLLINPKLFVTDYRKTVREVEDTCKLLKDKKNGLRVVSKQVAAVRQNIGITRKMRRLELDLAE